MNDRNTNRLNMINACLTLAEDPGHKPVWQGQAPLAFGADLAALKTAVAETNEIAAQIGGAPAGAADAKAKAETALEDSAYLLVAALRSYYRKTGDVENARKVDFTKSYLQRLRDTQLVTDTRAILAAAQAAVAAPEAVERGVTPAAVAALKAAITAFDALLNKPRASLVTRNTLRREISTRVADHLEDIANLDDLVLQFNSTPEGVRFIEAWQGARVIIDAGASQSDDDEEPTPAPTAATPAPVATGA